MTRNGELTCHSMPLLKTCGSGDTTGNRLLLTARLIFSGLCALLKIGPYFQWFM
jgi:hypothetical protein